MDQPGLKLRNQALFEYFIFFGHPVYPEYLKQNKNPIRPENNSIMERPVEKKPDKYFSGLTREKSGIGRSLEPNINLYVSNIFEPAESIIIF